MYLITGVSLLRLNYSLISVSSRYSTFPSLYKWNCSTDFSSPLFKIIPLQDIFVTVCALNIYFQFRQKIFWLSPHFTPISAPTHHPTFGYLFSWFRSLGVFQTLEGLFSISRDNQKTWFRNWCVPFSKRWVNTPFDFKHV